MHSSFQKTSRNFFAFHFLDQVGAPFSDPLSDDQIFLRYLRPACHRHGSNFSTQQALNFLIFWSFNQRWSDLSALSVFHLFDQAGA